MVSYSQSGPSSEGALNYKIKVWLSLPPASSVDFEDFTAQSSLGNTINFPQGMRGHCHCYHSPHSTPLGHAWANRTGRVFALLPKRIWVKTRFSRAKHQTSVRRCANREVVGTAGGHARI